MISSTLDLFDVIAEEAAGESLLWREAVRVDAVRVPVFSTLCDERFALALETIYEGYLCHYGNPRLFEPKDDELALLLGDYLYAHGLVRVAATGSVGAVAQLAELISRCARLRAEGEDGDGEAWLATAVALGREPVDAAAARLALETHLARVTR